MAAPTFVAEYESAWNTSTTPKTASVTVSTGDVLVVGALSESNNVTSTPTGGGLTYALQQNILVSQYTSVYVWTAVAASSQTFTLSVANAGGQQWGFNCLRFSGSDGVGASSKTNVASGAPSLAVTTGGANSAVVCFNGDWNAGGGARTWRTINSITPTSGNGLEVTYQATGNYTLYGAYWSDAGVAGSKTTGLTAPTGQKYAIVAIEVLGSAGGGGSTVDLTPAVAALTAVSVTAAPGPVTVNLTPVALALSATALNAVPGLVAVTLTPATLALAGQAVSPSPGLVTVALTPAAITLTAVAVTSAPGPITTTLTPATLAATASAVTPLPGVVVVALTAAGLTIAAVAVSPTGPGHLQPAALTLTAVTLTPVPGPVAVTLTPTTMSLAAATVTPTPDTAEVALTAALMLTVAAPVAAQPGPVAVTLTPAAVSLAAVVVGLGGGIIARPNTGVVARPNTGTIARPNTGIILRP